MIFMASVPFCPYQCEAELREGTSTRRRERGHMASRWRTSIGHGILWIFADRRASELAYRLHTQDQWDFGIMELSEPLLVRLIPKFFFLAKSWEKKGLCLFVV